MWWLWTHPAASYVDNACICRGRSIMELLARTSVLIRSSQVACEDVYAQRLGKGKILAHGINRHLLRL